MKKRRTTKLRFLLPITVGCLMLALIPFGCCIFIFIPRGLTHNPPETIGVRKGTPGETQQSIIRETSYTITGPFPGAHGPFTERKYSAKYFLEEPGKPRTELTFLRGERIAWYGGLCVPVDHSRLWVSAGQVVEPHVEYKVEVLVFDETQILHRRRLEFTVNWNDHKHDYWFENGNRLLVVRTAQGFKAYDVTTDTVAPWKPAKN